MTQPPSTLPNLVSNPAVTLSATVPAAFQPLAVPAMRQKRALSKLEQAATNVSAGLLGIPMAFPPDKDPATVYLAGLSEGSRRSQRRALQSIAYWLSSGACDEHTLNWPAVGPQHTVALVSTLQKLHEPATAERMFAALRGVLKACWRCRLMSLEDYNFVAGVDGPKGVRVPRGRALDLEEVQALFDMAEGDCPIQSARDRALLALMYGAGLRRSEAVALDATDVDLKNRKLLVRKGKGNKSRTVYLDEHMTAMVGGWLALRGTKVGPLLCEVRAGKIHLCGDGEHGLPRGISAQGLVAVLKRLAKRGSIADFASHDLRRTYIGELLGSGTDLATVQALAGHSNPATTVRYDRRGEERKREATDKRGSSFQSSSKLGS